MQDTHPDERHEAEDAQDEPSPGARAAAPWSKARIERMLASGKFGYQRIDLPFGLHTPGEDRRATADIIFPEDLSGKSVVDLGCNHGFFCFEALRRGAARAVGYDHSKQIVRRANRLAEIKQAPAEISVRDLDAEPVKGRFDYVLCLNALHHFDNPLLQLERMMDATREVLVLEVAGFGMFDYLHSLEVSVWVALSAWLLSKLPVVLVGLVRTSHPGEPRRLKYYFTRSAMRRIFSHHSDRFPQVDIVGSPFKSRFLVIARRSG